ncbi:MAG: DUF3108 domain-containing protein [Holophagae bacterium]|jgi:hypothetical protein
MKGGTLLTGALAAALLAVAAAAVIVSRAGEPEDGAPQKVADGLPTDGPYRYRVEYLGVKCGELTLECRRDEFDGRPVFHIIMTGRNSKFFNKIYRVDGRVDSWVDVETLATVAYRSDVSERGKREVISYRVDLESGKVSVDKNGKKSTVDFEGGPALDPVAFVFRSRVLGGDDGGEFPLDLLTDEGPIASLCEHGRLKPFSTYSGRRELRRIQVRAVDQEKYGRKGTFVLWIDPGPARTLYRLDFKLGFGRLLAKLVGEAEGSVDRRPPTPATN